ncbi:hypothetical protein L3Y34_013608 [Caenorhabditis briggsae]|uniref:Uncharacterized protein n=1 Tax=Caenorhabditis briggsae TaxID=6238 RepID=A0AAE8ZYV2_CAEBR|nr:hypothetical protein L3Y34_013608 [Caenorhabditis briggsae]
MDYHRCTMECIQCQCSSSRWWPNERERKRKLYGIHDWGTMGPNGQPLPSGKRNLAMPMVPFTAFGDMDQHYHPEQKSEYKNLVGQCYNDFQAV